MQNELKIALIQADLVWENPDQNRVNLESHIESINDPVDLIILPEMFTTGFTMNPKGLAESMDGKTVNWMKDLAQRKQSALVGSTIIRENGLYFNRLLFVHPDGAIDTYDKKHTFTLAGEHTVYEAGKENKIINYLGWSIKPLICYDLRFPVWARNLEDYDIVLYVANWPHVRISAWDALLKARAIENMSYSIGVNRVGLDGNGHEYPGHSAVYDVLGQRLDDIPSHKEAIGIITLNKSHISKYRNKLGFLKDRDNFNLE